jgi:hypothetical protein
VRAVVSHSKPERETNCLERERCSVVSPLQERELIMDMERERETMI